jgi:hypothetical protein
MVSLIGLCDCTRNIAYLVGREWIYSTPPGVIEPAVLLVCTEGAAANNMLFCFATATRVEDVAKASRFAGRRVSR